MQVLVRSYKRVAITRGLCVSHGLNLLVHKLLSLLENPASGVTLAPMQGPVKHPALAKGASAAAPVVLGIVSAVFQTVKVRKHAACARSTFGHVTCHMHALMSLAPLDPA